MLDDNFTILPKIKHIFFINVCADVEMLLKNWRKTKILLVIVFCFFVLHITIHLFFMKNVNFFKNDVEGVRIVIVDQHNEGTFLLVMTLFMLLEEFLSPSNFSFSNPHEKTIYS